MGLLNVADSHCINELSLTMCVGMVLNIDSMFPLEIDKHKLNEPKRNSSSGLKSYVVKEKDPLSHFRLPQPVFTAQVRRSIDNGDWPILLT